MNKSMDVLLLLILFANSNVPFGPIRENQQAAQGTAQDAEHLKAVAESGDAGAQDALGERYLIGEGVGQDKEEAVRWFRKAARQGNARAMYRLGAAYYNGDGVGIDDGLSYAWFSLANEAGYPDALAAVRRAEGEAKPAILITGYMKIADMYQDGVSLPRSPAKAVTWLSKAAEAGDAEAQVILANLLIGGEGFPRNYEWAKKLCEDAAKAGNRRGEYCLGRIYEGGLGVAKDAKKARERYEVGSVQGDIPSTKAAAGMEARGEGGKPELARAFLNYARLLVSGDKGVSRDLARLRKELTAKEWAALNRPLLELKIDPAKLDKALEQVGF